MIDRETDAVTLDIVQYVRERNAAVLSGVDALIEFAERCGQTFSCREAAEMTMHKLRTAITSLPKEERAASSKWLKERGLTTWDDGDLE